MLCGTLPIIFCVFVCDKGAKTVSVQLCSISARCPPYLHALTVQMVARSGSDICTRGIYIVVGGSNVESCAVGNDMKHRQKHDHIVVDMSGH